MLVEDDPEFSDFLSPGLSVGGFAVDVARTAREARALLPEEFPAYDLVIGDVRLSKKSGIELLLGDSIAEPRVPLIMMTAFGSQQLRKFVEDMGSFLLLKPFPLELLCRRVSDILQRKRIERPARAGSTADARP